MSVRFFLNQAHITYPEIMAIPSPTWHQRLTGTISIRFLSPMSRLIPLSDSRVGIRVRGEDLYRMSILGMSPSAPRPLDYGKLYTLRTMI